MERLCSFLTRIPIHSVRIRIEEKGQKSCTNTQLVVHMNGVFCFHFVGSGYRDYLQSARLVKKRISFDVSYTNAAQVNNIARIV